MNSAIRVGVNYRTGKFDDGMDSGGICLAAHGRGAVALFIYMMVIGAMAIFTVKFWSMH